MRGKECDCRYEANESALIRALIYIDVVLGFMIADFNYVSYLRRHSQMNHM